MRILPYPPERRRILWVFGALSTLCFTLTLLRVFRSGSPAFLFLNWNLFLAGIPLLISTHLVFARRSTHRPLRRWFLWAVWLLFLPNAPYLLTDLFHLKMREGIPHWYDLGVLLTFAWTGLYLGFRSMRDVEELAAGYWGRRKALMLTMALWFAAGYGVYLGRYVRWNSWEMITRPWSVGMDAVERLLMPGTHPWAWGMTLVFGLLLNIMYFLPRYLGETTDAAA